MDWLAAAFSLTGVFLMGRKARSCWFYFLMSNALWIGYCILNRQWAQLSLNVVFVVLNVLGYRKWSRDASNQTAAQSTKVDLTAAPLPTQVQPKAFIQDCGCTYPGHDPDCQHFSIWLDPG